MNQIVKLAGFVLAAACAVTFAQTPSTQVGSRPGVPPAAYVYVSNSPDGSNFYINAYGAATNGKLTSVAGSPFSTNGNAVGSLALNQKWLFGAGSTDIYSFSIATDGALDLVSSINAQQYNGGAYGGPVYLFLDHTGATVYDVDYDADGSLNNAFQFFDVNQTDGALSYLGVTPETTPAFDTYLRFTSNNLYAYGATCYHGDQDIYGFIRSSNGDLTELNFTAPYPPYNGGAYCPYLVEADPANHLAIAMQPTNDITPMGPYQLATYSVESSGKITTKSTEADMPAVAVGGVTDMAMSPSGRLLAVAGLSGLQVFHFNGSNPITHYTGLLTTNEVNQLFWDNDNHLYALSSGTNTLSVYTVTPETYGMATGSPHTITGASSIIVLPEN